jgi:hypothetical protein
MTPTATLGVCGDAAAASTQGIGAVHTQAGEEDSLHILPTSPAILLKSMANFRELLLG